MRFVTLETIEAPAGLPVSVEEFVDHARLNGLTVDRQPELIARELNAATLRAEHYLRRSLLTQTLQGLYLPQSGDTPGALALVLPRGKVQSVKAVTVAGAALDPSLYTVDHNVIALMSALPSSAAAEWVSGYGDEPEDVPAPIREGILQYAATLYDDRSGNREAKYQATAGRTIPAGVIDLWRPYQIEVSG